MPKVRVNAFAISLDGYGAGPFQDIENPLGRHGTTLHEWFYPTRMFQQMFGKDSGSTASTTTTRSARARRRATAISASAGALRRSGSS